MFVFSIALMLAVIGGSAWVYLNHEGEFSPKTISALAAIGTPLVLPDQVIPAAEKTASANQKEMQSAEDETDGTAQKPLASVATAKVTPTPATDPLEKVVDPGVLAAQPPEVTPADTAEVAAAKPAQKDTELVAILDPLPLEIPKTVERNPAIADGRGVTETVVEHPETISKNEAAIPAEEMREILNVEPAAGTPVVSETGTNNELPAVPAAEELVSVAIDEVVTAVETTDPAIITPTEAGPDIVVADIAPTDAVMLDTPENTVAPEYSSDLENTEEIVEASPDNEAKQLVPEIEGIKAETPEWLEEAPTLPIEGTVELALVLPPSQPSYTVMAPPVVDEVKPADLEPEAVSPPVEPVVLTLPITGKPLWQANAEPFEDSKNRPRIAIIISEMGISKAGTTAAIDQLPAAVTLAFNPYGQRLQSWIDKSRAKGHEVLLQLPMEPVGYPKTDPGPRALLTSLTPAENSERLNWSLNRFSGYAGLTNQMGSKFTASREHMEPVLAVLKEKDLLYVDSRTASNSVAAKIAKELSIPVALNNRFLDHRADSETLDARLAELENIALKSGSAIGIGYPYPATLERLAAWTASLENKGIVLAPVSALVNRQDIK
ncbi:divergent polysaccharide deacetylase family protein [Sneathiella marina]|uniref:Divergent polysaccharide deacetylase family protein n=1 Tax=Sneathiella marina TaxID=2950108 RepID=A0ABY4W7F8_9PROT|nr:divergent polysaccharide deacetylase family protein [Sneathiella marina]USG61690.1 divergent polysaccharide deacetylase family protein [Sneathiella marina]